MIFFIKSATVDITKFTKKDIPGSSGRLDVISRCILSTILNNDSLEQDVQIWVFLDKYGTFIFDSNKFNYDGFPINEIGFTSYFVDIIRQENRKENNPLSSIEHSKINILSAINQHIESNYIIFVLDENGDDFLDQLDNIRERKNVLFIIGDQSGDLINSKEITDLNLQKIKVGDKSLLASSIIRLIKLHVLGLV